MNLVTDKKWKTLSKKLLVENKFIQLWEDTVEQPDGKIAQYYVRRRTPFSIIIPLEKDIVYLVKQYRYPVASLSWEFPMGYVPLKVPGEIARQELKEETGMTAASLKELGKYWVAAGSSDQYAHIFLAQGLTKGEAEPEDGEFLTLQAFPLQEVGKMISTGQILDSTTIVTYHMLEQYLKI